MNDENLIPLNKRSQRERKEIQSKGGKASNAKKKKKKTLNECAKLLMSLDVKDDKAKKLLKSMGLDDNDDYTNGMLATVAIFKQAMAGNVQAYRVLSEAEEQAESENDETVRIIDDV